MSTPATWSVVTPKLHLRAWDGECVVFNGASGDTHLITHLAAEVLRRLQREPASVVQLRARLATNGVFAQSLEGILMDFERLGLIESIGH